MSSPRPVQSEFLRFTVSIFVITLVCCNTARAAATDLANVPLSSATTSSVKPNIFFILDDSGSMDRAYMPDEVDTDEVGYRNHLCNTIYYNPAVDYVVPKDSTGTNLHNAAPATYTAACSNGFSSTSCSTNLGTSYYWQYVGTTTNLAWPASGGNDCTLGSSIDITTKSGVCSNGSSLSASTYANPTSANCVTEYGVGKTLVWKRVTVTSASSDAQNYANWYSYYRTRLMMMKAAAGRAFQSILDNYRVGFMTISPGTYGNSSSSDGSATGSSISSSKFLKIADFDATHRADWYSKLYSQTTSSYTPLRSALSTAGRYYAGKNDEISKGMVPAQADDPVQYSCQQNFTILTTDGYWNSGSGRKLDGTSQIGNQDGVLSELDAYNSSGNKFAVSPRPIYDSASTTYVWHTGSIAYTQASCTYNEEQKKRVSYSRSTQQILKTTVTTVSTTEAKTNIIITAATTKNKTLTAVTINGANRLNGTITVADSNNAGTRKDSVKDGLVSKLNLGGFSVTASGTCNAANNPVSGCTQQYDRYVTLQAPSGSGNVSWAVTFTKDASISINVANFSGYTAASGPTTVGPIPAASCSAGTNVTGGTTVVTTCPTPNTTGPDTLDSACTSTTANSGNSYTSTTCSTTTVQDWTAFPGCTTEAASASNSHIATLCQTVPVSTGKKIRYQTTVTSKTYPGPSQTGTQIGSTATTTGSVTDLDGTCYSAASVPAYPNSGAATQTLTGTQYSSLIPANCTSGVQEWPCETSTASGGSSNSLSDVAQYYYKTDLRTSALSNCTGALGLSVCDNNVPSSGTDNEDDKANWQHMTTFTMGLGLSGTLSFSPTYKTDTTGTFANIRTGATNWPVPVADDPLAIDDLWHAAVNGRGQYFSAKDPGTVVDSLQSALAGVSARVASAAAAATSNLEPVAGDNFAYTAKYVTQQWTGELEAHEIDLESGAVLGTAIWSAATKMDSLAKSACDTRNIKLFRSGATHNLVDFKWNTYECDGSGAPTTSATTLSAEEQAHFSSTGTDTQGQTIDEIANLSQYPNLSAAQKSDASGANLVNYLRGQRSKEGFDSGPPATNTAGDSNKLYRARSSVLGDIISAQPVFVRAPFADYAAETDPGYATFRSNNASRTPMVFVAANDGMLHAFYAGTSISDTQGGVEAWAFIPTHVLPNLYKLAAENYASNHVFSVDGTPTAADVFDSTASAGCAASTPTNPENCWKTILVGGLNKGGQGYYALDITDPANPKGLWELKKSATCISVNATTKAPTSPAYADCHLGYSYNNPIVGKLSNGTWAVFVTSGYNNDDGVGYLYVLNAVTGQIIYRISTGAGDSATPSGLNHINGWASNATVNNTIERIYGADLLGNIWRFDVNDSIAPSGREATKVAQVVDSSSNPQPITTRPELAEVNGQPFVYVSTGRYLGTTDLSDTQTQTIWAIQDPMTSTAVTNLRSTLGQRTITNVGTGTSAYRTVTSDNDCAVGAGWYADLPDTGERVSIDMKLQLGTLIVPSNVPSSNACTIGGYSWLNYVDYQSGCAVVESKVGTRLVGSSGTESLAVGINVVRLPNGKTVVIATTSAAEQITLEAPFDTPPPVGKRVSWREIIQ